MNCNLVAITLEPLRRFREYKFIIVHRTIKKNSNTALTSHKKKKLYHPNLQTVMICIIKCKICYNSVITDEKSTEKFS